jgi:hypothetical protein
MGSVANAPARHSRSTKSGYPVGASPLQLPAQLWGASDLWGPYRGDLKNPSEFTFVLSKYPGDSDAPLPLAVDADNGMIVAQTLTDQDVDDPSQVAPLLDQIDGGIAKVTADGAYDGSPTYATIAAYGDGVEVMIPPRSTAVLSGEQGPLAQRDRHLKVITERGPLAWQIATDYGQRPLVETTMGRYKELIGPWLRTRGFAAQQAEAAIGVTVLNRMLAAGCPDSVRCQRVIA